MQTSQTPPETEGASLYERSLRELAGLLGLDPADVLRAGAIEAEGVQFHFLPDARGGDDALCVLAEIGEIPASDEQQVLRQLLEANSHLSAGAGTYALIPGTGRAALRIQVPLRDGESHGDQLLAVLTEHIAVCTAVRHVGVGVLVEPTGSVLNPDMA